MFTFLGGVLGFFGSAFPDILGIFKDKQNKKHELAMLEKQISMQNARAQINLEQMNVKADIEESKSLYKHASKISDIPWVNALQSSVRPVITYAFFLLFAVVKTSALFVLINHQDMDISNALIEIWDLETQSLFATVMAFWFGQRALMKVRHSSALAMR